MVDKYPVITLCGSTRFKNEFMMAQKKLTLEGNIVISVGLFGHSGDEDVWVNMDEGTLTKTKEILDDMHKRKIDMSDEIFVINKDGYKSVIYEYESNRRGINGDILIDRAKVLHTTPEYIMNGTSPAEEDPYISAVMVLLK